MQCKKCKKAIDDDSIYCKWCGVAQKRDKKKTMYRRPDGLFEKVVTLNGKRQVFRAKSEPEVYRKIAAYEEKQEAGRTFKEVAEEWKEEHFKTLSPTTQRGYSAAYNRAVDELGQEHIRGITPSVLKQFVDRFAAKGRARKTVANQVAVLNMVFEYAGLYDELKENPMQYVKVPKGLYSNPRELPSDKDIFIVKNSVNLPFGLFPFFILYSGCRRGEALAIKHQDIDRVKKEILINKSVYYISTRPELKLPKTRAGLRKIPLLDILAEQIPNGNRNDFIFGETGPLARKQLDAAWEGYVKQTGIECTLHQLRHAFATMLYEAEINRKDAQEILGHADIHTTDNIYTHISETQRKNTANKLNEFTKNTQNIG